MAKPRTPRVIGAQDYPLREQVRDELRARIADGRIGPGDRMVEQALADEFGVSRIPVREALRMLETEGLVHNVPRRGVIVSELTRPDIEHLFDIREALEVLVFRLAADRATPRDVRRLEKLLERAKAAMAKERHSDVTQINADFHEAVTDLAGNPFLHGMLEPLTGRLRVLIGRSHEYERQAAEHAGLVEALADRDPDRAAALALAHIRTSRAHALAQYDAAHAQEGSA
ncbi:GntR family transcriptional regulator [Saccharopolyspora sp. NPDC003752]